MGVYRIKPKAGDTFLIPGDLHFPIHDAGAIKAMCDWYDKYPGRKGVICQGDTVDTHAISHHRRRADRLAAFPRLVDEVAPARPFLEWAGATELGCTYVPGNHEDFVTDLIDEQPGLSGAPGMDWPTLTGLGDIDGVEFVPYNTWVALGRKLVVVHGDGLPAKPHLMTQKFPDQVTVYGHTHALGAYYQTVYDSLGGEGVRGAVNVGHMSCTKKHEYVSHPNWQQGFAVAEFFGEKSALEPFFRVQLHQILRDWEGKPHVA
jgi:predicted phosphodiesterase